ncbi:MAG: hypothetical protein A2Y57_04500 [Candidatus Woykebacteria bacterium RBG_13_40_7b]|uniref:ABC transmembrane type-2 domain-containing protein n=1 Tax=Candidatus Woykebacteria bacterium RBG_13_40_7b TaxID=1802594 RepID=A0A1G1W7V6_9BACT|nr:MAG: hypothetical protein A2Y57_04500 [Candidatus Woykebacteria bacterium RBG_13_40_7b]
MNISRIKAILLQELYITKRSLEVILDLFFFSIMTIVVFGFVSLFLTGNITGASAHYLILGLILWEIIRINQYSISVGALWNVWSRNLSNMFIAPISVREYLAAHMISGVVKTFTIFIIISLVSSLFFKFNIFNLGPLNLFFFFVNLIIFSWTIGIALLGVIFRFGTRIQALAWGSIFLFQPLTASFFPVTVLPNFLQKIAFALPPTYVFEAARAALVDPTFNWKFMLIALVLNAFYFLVSLWFFNYMFRRSKETGQFARLEG